jgi:hypothetical protein
MNAGYGQYESSFTCDVSDGVYVASIGKLATSTGTSARHDGLTAWTL